MTADAAIFAQLFTSEGASSLTWESGTRCTCFSEDTKQPRWGCPTCGGFGVAYTAPVTVRALFRSQSRWRSPQMMGELALGEAQLTTPIDVKPAYADRRVRDRFTVIHAAGDQEVGRVFYPTAQPVPFIFGDVQYAWRVTVSSLEQETNRVVPQP